MPEVYFELSGEDFSVDAAMAGSPLFAHADVHRRGEATGFESEPVFEASGLQVWIGGDEEAGLEQQIREALGFVRNYAAEIRRLRGLPGITVAHLRFSDHWPNGIGAHSAVLPSALLLACGELGLDIVLCGYLLEKWEEALQATAEPVATPNSRPPSPLSQSPDTQTPDPLRTPPPGGCG